MKIIINALTVVVLMGCSLAARADLLLDFNPLNGRVGATVAASASFFTVTAQLSERPWKATGGDGQSLSLAELLYSSGSYQLSLTNFAAANHESTFRQAEIDSLNHLCSNCEVRVQTVADGEEYERYGYSMLGTFGVRDYANADDTSDDLVVPIPQPAWTNNPYTATAGTPQDNLNHPFDNVLVDAFQLTVQIPEPSTFMLVAGCLSMAMGWRRFKKIRTIA